MLYTENCSVMSNDLSISFIDRLVEQYEPHIQDFLSMSYPGYSCSFRISKNCDTDESCIVAIAYNPLNNDTRNIMLEQFSSNIAQPDKWIKFLSNIFGSEYSKAFLKYGCSIFEDE